MVRIAEILSGTIAEALELEIGSRIIRINGESVRDGIDFRFLESDAYLEVEVAPAGGGHGVVYEIEKDAGETLGVVPAPDAVRECANKCVFCFIDGNPPGVRRSLDLRDDDFRLSFEYGNYVTLTNLGPRGFRRLIEQRLSPLYVSVHATEPAVRMRLLGVPRGGDLMDRLAELIHGGLEVHTQVVLCPGWNDGAHFDRTLEDLWALGSGVLSVTAVPVGLTRYNLERPVRLLTRAEAVAALEQVDRARARAFAGRGHGWAYAADELYFLAERPMPLEPYYDDWPLTENGVGAVRRFLVDFERSLAGVPGDIGGRAVVVTGTRMAPVVAGLAPRLAERTGGCVDVIPVRNGFFGETVTTAGLLPGRDVLAALRAAGAFDIALIPASAVNDDRVFIDDVPLDAVRSEFAGARIGVGHDLVSALRAS